MKCARCDADEFANHPSVKCHSFIWPPPGGDSALAQGCRCAVLDNCHGLGRGSDGAKYGWWVSGDCPLHAPGESR